MKESGNLVAYVRHVIGFLIRVHRTLLALVLGLGWIALILVGTVLGRMADRIRESEQLYRR